MAHVTHIGDGIEGCLRRVLESLFWPMMASDVKNYVSKCDVCLAHRTSQLKLKGTASSTRNSCKTMGQVSR